MQSSAPEAKERKVEETTTKAGGEYILQSYLETDRQCQQVSLERVKWNSCKEENERQTRGKRGGREKASSKRVDIAIYVHNLLRLCSSSSPEVGNCHDMVI